MSHSLHGHVEPGLEDDGPACGCGMDPDPANSTGFLPIGVALALLVGAYVLGLFG